MMGLPVEVGALMEPDAVPTAVPVGIAHVPLYLQHRSQSMLLEGL